MLNFKRPSSSDRDERRLPPIAGGSDAPEADEPEPLTDLAPPAETPPPAEPGLTRAEFQAELEKNNKAWETRMEEQRQAFAATLEASRRAAAPPPAADADLTDEQIEAKVEAGEWTRTTATRYITDKATREFQRTHVAPLQQVGASSISALSKTTAMTMTDDKGKLLYPYFRRWEKEVDAVVKSWGDGIVMTPEMYGRAYQFVAGGHLAEVQAETHEAAVRAANAPKPESVAAVGRTGRTTPAPGDGPDAVEVFGSDEASLAAYVGKEKRGRSLDEQARAMGYKDWKSYAKMAAELETA